MIRKSKAANPLKKQLELAENRIRDITRQNQRLESDKANLKAAHERLIRELSNVTDVAIKHVLAAHKAQQIDVFKGMAFWLDSNRDLKITCERLIPLIRWGLGELEISPQQGVPAASADTSREKTVGAKLRSWWRAAA